jgi:hypothetical protein
VTVPAAGGRGMVLRRGTGGFYVNGIVARWPAAAIAIRDAATGARLQAGDLVLSNILAAENGTLFETGAERFQVDAGANGIETTAVTVGNLFATFGAPGTAGLDWTPSDTSPARTGGLASFSGALATRAGTFVTATAYRGAADPNGADWWAGWTSYARN